MTSITRILVPTDFSQPADEALDYAFRLSQTLGATVSVVHVFVDPFEPTLYAEQYIPMPQEIRDEVLDQVRRRLSECVARGGRANVTSAILAGAPARAIVDSARDQHADLIVMGTHGRHGMAHLLLGSVAERVVRTATCPVLTVRGAAVERQTKVAA